MAISIKKILISTALVFSVYFLNVHLIQDIHAASVVEEIRKKGQQCRSWVEAGVFRGDQVSNCLAACERYSYSLEKYPEMLSDLGIQRCNESYSGAKQKHPDFKKPIIPIAKAPDTIEEMIKDMNKATQEYKEKVEKASTSTLKRQAQDCHDACSRGVAMISREGTHLSRAKVRWAGCTRCGEPETVPDEFKTSRVLSNEKIEPTMSSMPDVEGIFVGGIKGRLRVKVEGRDDWTTTCVASARLKNYRDEFMKNLKAKDRVRLIGITYDPNRVGKGSLSHCIAETGIILGPSQ